MHWTATPEELARGEVTIMNDEFFTFQYESPEKTIEHTFSEDVITWPEALFHFHHFLQEAGYDVQFKHQPDGRVIFFKEPVQR